MKRFMDCPSKYAGVLSACAVLLLSGASPVFATLISAGTVTLDGSESITSTERVFRSGVPSSWTAPKLFPGTLPCAGSGTCYYETVSVVPGSLGKVRVTYEWLTGNDANIFLVGYRDSFDVTNLGLNYLGDPGFSVLAREPGPRAFEILVPTTASLILAFSTVPDGLTGFGTVSYSVEGFPVPEPATALLLGLGLLAVGLRRRIGW